MGGGGGGWRGGRRPCLHKHILYITYVYVPQQSMWTFEPFGTDRKFCVSPPN